MTNTAKKLVFAILAVAMMMTMITAVSAANSATLKISDTVLENGKFTFRVTVEDVNDPKGAAGFAYNLIYDSSVFELESATTVVPSDWNTSSSSEYDDLSTLIEKGNYLCAHVSIIPGKGAESGELYTDFTFKVNGDAVGKTFKLTDISIASDDVEELYSGGNLTFKVPTSGDPDVSNEPVSEDTESGDESSEDISNLESSDESSEDSVDPDSSEQNGESNENNESNEPDASSDQSSDIPSNSEGSGDNSSDDNGGFPWWIIIVIVAVIAIAAVVFIIIRRKKNNY